MKKFELKTANIEMTREMLEKYPNAEKAFFELDDHCAHIVKAFDTEEEAIAAFDEYKLNSARFQSGAVSFYLFELVFVEENDYDEDGEWIDGGICLAAKESEIAEGSEDNG